MSTATGNVGAAIGIVCGAGAATGIGSAVVFFPSLVKLASRRVLAGSLGLSAGVMIYVSFVEIFAKSVSEFAMVDGVDEDLGYIYATLSFFGGAAFMMMLDVLQWFIAGRKGHSHSLPGDERETSAVTPHCVCASHGGDVIEELQKFQQRAEEEIEINAGREDNTAISPDDVNSIQDADNVSAKSKDDEPQDAENQDAEQQNKTVEIENGPDDEQKKLGKMGFNTALAIALHNFPEGLATFVAALNDPSVGMVLAIAIGIHNIPEGLCVALPIYYATGNRWKAFLWGCASGLSEPVAALLGWAILANAMTASVYAILFGLVSGMMVIISLKDLLPTAHRYDPEDTVVTYSLVGGMVIIALSLVLFKI